MSKHTSGPWEVVINDGHYSVYNIEQSGDTIYSPTGVQSVCDLYGALSNFDYDDAEANAHLIAAAPDMLSALKDAFEVLSHENYYPGYTEIVKNAIEKATGESL